MGLVFIFPLVTQINLLRSIDTLSFISPLSCVQTLSDHRHTLYLITWQISLMASAPGGFPSFTFPKLEGSSNFPQWKVMCVSWLQSCGAWKFFISVVIPPLQDPAKKDYLFQERLEAYHSRVAQARNIILSSCKPHIQQTLANVLLAQNCWDKIVQTYGMDGLVHIQETWATFYKCRY